MLGYMVINYKTNYLCLVPGKCQSIEARLSNPTDYLYYSDCIESKLFLKVLSWLLLYAYFWKPYLSTKNFTEVGL